MKDYEKSFLVYVRILQNDSTAQINSKIRN